MRLWSSDPRTMCRRHLVGEHVECHMIVGAILKGKSLDGFYAAGLIDTSMIRSRHDLVAAEMRRRGYSHASPLPEFDDPRRGFLNKETPQRRCQECMTLALAGLRGFGETEEEHRKRIG